MKNFSFVALLKGGQEQEVANLVIEQTPGQPEATVQVQGHPAVYGPNVYYSAALPIATALFLAWALAPRPAPLRFALRLRRVPAPIIVRMRRCRWPPIGRPSPTTPGISPCNGGPSRPFRQPRRRPMPPRWPPSFRQPLTQPGQTQRQFQQRDGNRPVASGGFGQGPASRRAIPPSSVPGSASDGPRLRGAFVRRHRRPPWHARHHHHGTSTTRGRRN
jgi:hypothetical protein